MGEKKGTIKTTKIETVAFNTNMSDGLMSELFEEYPEAQLNMAQALIYDAWEAEQPAQAIAMAKAALEISPDCADAFVLLAEEAASSLEEAMEMYRKGVEAGERAIGSGALTEDAGYFWGLLETRPYMRARFGLAQCLWDSGGREDSVAHYQDMLRLNPNDNQGIRYVLAACLLELERDDELKRLLKDYKGDYSAAWFYTEALLQFCEDGDIPASRRLLAKARKLNKHVPAFLLGKRKLPRQWPDFYSPGDDREAIGYVDVFAEGWKQRPGALEWLASTVK